MYVTVHVRVCMYVTVHVRVCTLLKEENQFETEKTDYLTENPGEVEFF